MIPKRGRCSFKSPSITRNQTRNIMPKIYDIKLIHIYIYIYICIYIYMYIYSCTAIVPPKKGNDHQPTRQDSAGFFPVLIRLHAAGWKTMICCQVSHSDSIWNGHFQLSPSDFMCFIESHGDISLTHTHTKHFIKQHMFIHIPSRSSWKSQKTSDSWWSHKVVDPPLGSYFGWWIAHSKTMGIHGIYADIAIAGWWFWATPLKNMSSSIGMMRFPIFLGKSKMATKPPTSYTSWGIFQPDFFHERGPKTYF